MADLKHILGDEEPIGFACFLCDTVYPRIYQVRWKTIHDRHIKLEYICRHCFREMDGKWLDAKYFDQNHPDDLATLTGEVKELPKRF